MCGMAVVRGPLRDTSPAQGLRPTANPFIPGTAARRGRPSGEDGQSFVEYGFIMALVVVVGITAVVLLGGAIDTLVTGTIGALIALLP